MDEAPGVLAFEMLVERLSNLESASASVLNDQRYLAEHGPAGTVVTPSILGRTDNLGVIKHYKGRLQLDDVVAVRCDFNTVDFMTPEWALGIERHLSDDLVDASIGLDAANAIRQKCATRPLRLTGYGSADTVGMPSKHMIMHKGWLDIAFRHKFPGEVLSFGKDIVMKVGVVESTEPTSNSFLQRVVDVASEMLHIAGISGNTCLDVYRVHPAMVEVVLHTNETTLARFPHYIRAKEAIDNEIKRCNEVRIYDHPVYCIDFLEILKRSMC
jgi:hypothetical protein